MKRKGPEIFFFILYFLFAPLPVSPPLHGLVLCSSSKAGPPPYSSAKGKNETLSARIYVITLNSVGMDTGSLPGGGIYSSSAAVSKILGQALEQPLKIVYLSDLYQWLKSNALPIKKPSELLPGDIVISPSSRDVQGHVGIVGEKISEKPDFSIYSNSLDSCLFLKNWTLSRWREYFEKDLKLDVFYFRVFKPFSQQTLMQYEKKPTASLPSVSSFFRLRDSSPHSSSQSNTETGQVP
ncbi:hypothetical protein [Candidatus Methylacidiphilum infernorum]|uniref:hypothetical protein n=1 Tax=Candidatus Methylacidiphilum infernorum TaxID=511746 RepID=UPI0002DF30E2|nr:hypothetical protein [Candidatus Methylacidiphilum infernorum]